MQTKDLYAVRALLRVI